MKIVIFGFFFLNIKYWNKTIRPSMKLQLIFFKSWFLEYIIHIKNMIY